MKIICTKEEFAEMLDVCTHRVDDGECGGCLLYNSCGGEKGIIKVCRVEEPKVEHCAEEHHRPRRPTRAEWMETQKRMAEYGDR